MISFTCPKCRNMLRYEDRDAGIKIPCPSCGQRLQVPLPAEPQSRTVMGELLPVQARTWDPAPQPEVLPVPASSPSIIRTVCPHCQAAINAPVQRAGTTAPCPRCRLTVTIPGAMPQPVQEAPPVVVNVINASLPTAALAPSPSLPGEAFAQAATQEEPSYSYRRRRKSTVPKGWIVAGVTLAIIGSVILGAFFFAGEGPFKPKPKDLIVGKWEFHNANLNKTGYMVFYKDGEGEMVLGSTFKFTYRFVDDLHVEVVPRQGPTERLEVAFPSTDEMALTRPGEPKARFKRVK